MRQYSIKSGKEYYPECWEIAKERSDWLIITQNDAEFEKSKREREREMIDDRR